jgi:hypothetical protein
MALNVLNIPHAVVVVVSAIIILLAFGLAFSRPFVNAWKVPVPRQTEPRKPMGQPDAQKRTAEERGEKVKADEYVESFNGDVYGGQGPIPLLVLIFLIAFFIWWAAYLVLEWSQYLFSVRSFR